MSPVMNRTRVYAPETNEPFDVTTQKAAELVLLKGWTKSPVTSVPVSAPETDFTVEDGAGLPDANSYVSVEDADVIAEDAPSWRTGRSRGRGRKTFGSEESADEA